MQLKRAHFGRSLALGIVLVGSLLGGVVQAAPQALTITPTSTSPVIKPGQTFNGTFQIVNNGPTGYDYTVYSTPYHVSGEDYTPSFNVIRNAPDASEWFTLGTTKGHSSPDQTTTVKYGITVPASTPPGGYYATVFAQTHTADASQGGVTVNERVGEIFYIQVAGPVTQQGKVLGWKLPFVQASPVTASVRLQNTGGLHYPATVNYTISDIFGHSKYKFHATHEVLPQTTRRVAMSWDKAPPIGLFKVTGSASYLKTTETMHTQWLLVMSNAFRVAFLIIVVILVILWVTRRAARSRAKHKSGH